MHFRKWDVRYVCVHACVCVCVRTRMHTRVCVSLMVVLIVMVGTNSIISGGIGNLAANESQNMHMQ